MKVINGYAVEASNEWAEDPAYAFITLLSISVLYWTRYEKAETPTMPSDITELAIQALTQVDGFCNAFQISLRSLHGYFNWILHMPPDNGGELEEKLNTFLDNLRVATPRIKQDSRITYDEIDIINNARLWHSNKNPSKLGVIRKMLARLNAPRVLQQGFTIEVQSQDQFVQTMKVIVKKLTGKEGLSVPMEKIPEYREKSPDLWKEYLDVNRAINGVYNNALQNYVSDAGAPQPLEEVRKHLDEKGIVHRLPSKVLDQHVLIDGEGKLYTKDGHVIKGIPDPQSKVTVNPGYSAEKDLEHGKNLNWVFKTTLPTKNAKGENNEQYYYTENKAKTNKAAKFDIIQQMLKIESKMVNAWRKDLKQSKDPARKILAAQCEISYLTAARIGGEGNENRHGKTYGLTTLLVGNLKKSGDSRVLDYIGKDSVHQIHKISPDTPSEEEVIHVLDVLASGKKRVEPLFEYDGKIYNASKLRAYFKEICPIEGATPHKIRHLRGTRLADEILEPIQEKLLKSRGLTQQKVDAAFKEGIMKVGKLLGHVRGVKTEAKVTYTTALQSYIDPSVSVDFYQAFEDRGIRIPRFLAKIAG